MLAVKLSKKYKFFSVVVMLQLMLVIPVRATAPTDARLDLHPANATTFYRVARHAAWMYVPPAAAFESDESLRLAFNATRLADAADGVNSNSCDVDVSRFHGWWSDASERSAATHAAVAIGLIAALAVGVLCTVSSILPAARNIVRQRLRTTSNHSATDSAASQPPIVLGAVDPSIAEAAPSPSPSPPAWDSCSAEGARDARARVSRPSPSPPGWDLLVGSSKQGGAPHCDGTNTCRRHGWGRYRKRQGQR